MIVYETEDGPVESGYLDEVFVPPEVVEAVRAELAALCVKHGLVMELRHPGHPDQKVHGRRGHGHGAAIGATVGWDDLTPKERRKVEDQLFDVFGGPVDRQDDKQREAALKKIEVQVQKNYASAYDEGLALVPDGAEWYQHSHKMVSDLAAVEGRDPTQMAAAVAVLSRQREYTANMKDVKQISQALRNNATYEVSEEEASTIVARSKGKVQISAGTYDTATTDAMLLAEIGVLKGDMPSRDRAPIRDAIELLRGDVEPEEGIGGPKQRNFFNNNADPDDGRWVTIDTWDYRAAVGTMPLTATVKGVTQTKTLREWKAEDDVAPQKIFQGRSVRGQSDVGVYSFFVKQHQVAAKRRGITPAGHQAVVWNGERGRPYKLMPNGRLVGYKPTTIGEIRKAIGLPEQED